MIDLCQIGNVEIHILERLSELYMIEKELRLIQRR